MAGWTQRLNRLYSRIYPLGGKRAGRQCIVVHEDTISIPATGQHVQLPGSVHSEETFLTLVPAGIHELLTSDSPEMITLFISPVFFAYTSFTLPGIEPGKLRDALSLQLQTLLPGSSESDLLAYMDFNYHEDSGGALWMKSSFADALTDALASFKIYVEKIIPRPFACFDPSCTKGLLEDIDGFQRTMVEVGDGCVKSWHCLTGSDLDNDAFAEEYNTAKERKKNRFHDDEQFCLSGADYGSCPMNTDLLYFVPHRHRAMMARRRKNKTVQWVVGVVVVLLVGLAVPVLLLREQASALHDKIAVLKQENSENIVFSRSVKDFARRWSIIDDFPDVDVYSLFILLNGLVPGDSWLVSLTLDNGLLEITGYSPDPDAILLLFSRQEQFDDVAFSQVVRVEDEKETKYFGIECRINNIDILSYLDRYFHDENAR